MITLYELHWSHYCEKIRWALDYKKISWKKININAFSKKEMLKYPCSEERRLVPFIYDEKTKIALGDSSPILRYLDETYPDFPLFHENPSMKELIFSWLIELDTKLALVARRLGYSQIILENPGILAQLFLSNVWGGMLAWLGIRRFSGACLGMLLIKRFRFELNEQLNLYEELEQYLLSIAKKLEHQEYLVGDVFTAADLTLAVYLRPLKIIPFFNEHPHLKKLFQWQEKLLLLHNRDTKLLYETLIENHRKKRPPVRRKLKPILNQINFIEKMYKKTEETKKALNDQEKIWTWGIIRVPYHYFIKMKQNKIRQKLSSEKVR